MKLVSHMVSVSILASSLAAFNVPSALASDMKPMKPLELKTIQNKQEVIKAAFAHFSVAMTSTKSVEAKLIYRQAMTDAAKSFKAAGVIQKDLIEYATSDMNPAEAAAFRSQVSNLSASDLSSPEGEELLQRILKEQGKGSNFLPCGLGTTIAFTAGLGAFIIGILALTKLEDVTKKDRQQNDLDRAAIESEIDILRGEGVREDSYLIASRKAEIQQLDIEYAQMLDQKESDRKGAVTLGIIAGGLAVTAIVGAIGDDCNY